VVLGLYYMTRERIGARGEAWCSPRQEVIGYESRAWSWGPRVGCAWREHLRAERRAAHRAVAHRRTPRWGSAAVRDPARGLSFESHPIRNMTKKAISATNQTRAIAPGAQGNGGGADTHVHGFHYATRARNLLRDRRHRHPGKKTRIVTSADNEVKEIQDQTSSRLVTNGERLQQGGPTSGSRANDQVARP